MTNEERMGAIDDLGRAIMVMARAGSVSYGSLIERAAEAIHMLASFQARDLRDKVIARQIQEVLSDIETVYK